MKPQRTEFIAQEVPMQLRGTLFRPAGKAGHGLLGRPRRLSWGRVALCLAAMGVVAAGARPVQQGTAAPASAAAPSSAQSTPPDADAKTKAGEDDAKKQDLGAIGGERKKPIAEASANLLKMANDLNAEVNKTSKDTLSVAVVRKADAIEKLARDLRGKK